MSIEIYDTTLRDGAQGVGINFSVSDKLRIAEHLDTLGVAVVEGGWPGANPTDTEFFAAMTTRPLRNATLAAFGATRRAGVRPQDDPQLRTLLELDGTDGDACRQDVGSAGGRRAPHDDRGEPGHDRRVRALARRRGPARRV